VKCNPPSDSYKVRENWNVRRLAARGVPPGDTCKNSGKRGACRLAARVARQAIWKRIVPSDLWVAPGDTVKAKVFCLL